jgi:hypothetical protein
MHKKYAISADTATAGGNDYCAAHVIELESVEQVAEYRGHMNPADFGHMLVNLAIEYGNALLIIENNSIGLATVQSALDDEYENLYWTKRGTLDFVDPNDFDYNDNDIIPGFSTTVRTRPLMIQKYQDYVNDHAMKINSVRTINEMWTFIWEKGKAQASSGNNDDLTIALSILLWVRDGALKMISRTTELNKQKLDLIFKPKPIEGDDVMFKITGEPRDPWKMTVGPDGAEFDLRELLK